MHRIAIEFLPLIPCACLALLFAYLDRLMRQAQKLANGDQKRLLREARIGLWGSWACVAVAAIVSVVQAKP